MSPLADGCHPLLHAAHQSSGSSSLGKAVTQQREHGVHIGDRGRGRELALLALCHLESYAADERDEALELFWRDLPGSDEVQDFHSWGTKPKVVALIVFAVRGLSAGSGSGDKSDAAEILRERYAKGEIDDNEYERRKAKLGL